MYTHNHFVDYYDPTIEDTYRKTVSIENPSAKKGEASSSLFLLDILDTAGQEEFSALRDSWIRGCSAFLLTYSITSRSSLEELSGRVRDIERAKMDEGNYSIHVVGNKKDLEDSREVEFAEARQFCKQLGIQHVSEISAKTREGLTEAWEALIRDAAPAEAFGSSKKPTSRNAGCIIL